MKEGISQRDAFWNSVFDCAKKDRNVVVVAADMGAPSLDRFRRDLSSQFFDVGIAEQQAVALATGLALAGKKVFAYAIAPFITLRCYEHIRLDMAAMDLPVTLVGVGAGFSYEDSGPTHHCVEDLSVMRILPNLQVHNMTDSVMAGAYGAISCGLKHPNYVRLDRQLLPSLYREGHDFSEGVSVLKRGKRAFIVATGNMVHRALDVAKSLSKRFPDIGVIDAYTLPLAEKPLLAALRGAEKVITLEEHTLPGGLGGAVCEILADNGVTVPIRRIGVRFESTYCYKYGGRESILKRYGLSGADIANKIGSFLG
ncbi:MAG: transketolase C-terminal domain-containing protein [Elusimicrobiota bacterium]|jgi:transketolase